MSCCVCVHVVCCVYECGDGIPQPVKAVNIGEVDSWIPEELSEEDKIGGRWWRQLLAGGGAGAGGCGHILCYCY